ncbi:MAG: RNA-guided pseudouridylation complex pseudouridine synthase subunit Cbf5 [Candidatus Aenigmatarchaeota archaeon]|nr:RNA-guided pseudouridylation complex pseudouridine synthase subunit Cbf5 [Candidatus Aenigmarchaeota archaeon]
MWLIKSEEESSLEYGKSPKDRTIEELINSALIIVDKNSGPTSHQITAWVRDIFNVKNCGHSGTLDPSVTGVLPIALENATKAMPVLTGLDKEYVGVMHLHKEVSEDILRDVIVKKFVGKIRQVPPKKSAVARVEREREIYFFDILEIENKDVLFKVGCEAGTYIRKLCHDIGQALKVGAHMSELRRTKVGNFTEDDARSLVEIRDAYELWKENKDETNLRKILIPIEYAIPHVKKVFVKDSAVDALCNGSPLYPNGITRIQEGISKGELVAVMTLKEELIALGISKMTSEEMLNRKTGISVRVDRVLMSRGMYPKWGKA